MVIVPVFHYFVKLIRIAYEDEEPLEKSLSSLLKCVVGLLTLMKFAVSLKQLLSHAMIM